MEAIRVLLAGRPSRVLDILEYLVAKAPDLVTAGRLDPGIEASRSGSGHAMTVAAAKRHDANVLILAAGGTELGERRSEGPLGRLDSELAQAILDELPNVIVVLITSLGRRISVHSAVHVDNIGIEGLVDTIRAAWRGAATSVSD